MTIQRDVSKRMRDGASLQLRVRPCRRDQPLSTFPIWEELGNINRIWLSGMLTAMELARCARAVCHKEAT